MKIKELDSNYRFPAPLQKNCRISNHAEDFLLNYINAKIGENGFAHHEMVTNRHFFAHHFRREATGKLRIFILQQI